MTAPSRPPALSCTSFSFSLLPLESVLRLVQMLELEMVDLCIADGAREVRSRDLETDPMAVAATHRQWCDGFGLQVADVFAHLGCTAFDRPINTVDPALREANRIRAVQYLRYAAAVGSPGLTISPGASATDTDTLGAEEAFDRACKELAWLVNEGESHGIAVSVEPHQGSVAATVRETVELCNAVSGLSLTLDHSHFLMAGTKAADIHPLFRLARHAHLRQARPGQLQCPTEDGDLDVGDVLDSARSHGFQGSFALEYVNSVQWDMNRLDVLSETIRLRDEIRRRELNQ